MKKTIVLIVCFAFLSPAFAKPDHTNKKQKKLPPGLEKKLERGKELPPGWQKKIAKGEVLDDDLYRHAVAVTKKERIKYPASTPGTRLLRINGKIIRIMDATRTILDVFEIGGNGRL